MVAIEIDIFQLVDDFSHLLSKTKVALEPDASFLCKVLRGCEMHGTLVGHQVHQSTV